MFAEEQLINLLESYDFVYRYKATTANGFVLTFEYQNKTDRKMGRWTIPPYFIEVNQDGAFRCSYSVKNSVCKVQTSWASPITNEDLVARIVTQVEAHAACLNQFVSV